MDARSEYLVEPPKRAGTGGHPPPQAIHTVKIENGITPMLMNLVFGISTMTLCPLLQSLLLLAAARYYSASDYLVNSPSLVASIIVVNGVMFLLVIGNIMQAAIWALVFQVLGEFDLFSKAFYHSMVNFATLGYGDFVMSEKHKLLGPIEAINGVLMIGVSTAALMAFYQDAIKKTLRARGK
jgi:hypothetical protein